MEYQEKASACDPRLMPFARRWGSRAAALLKLTAVTIGGTAAALVPSTDGFPRASAMSR
jgi:hypothetical protein